VDHIVIVGVGDRIGHLLGDGQGLIESQRAGSDAFGQRGTFHQFHHQRAEGAGFFQSVQGGNIGVIEGGQQRRRERIARTGEGGTDLRNAVCSPRIFVWVCVGQHLR
jgi:hypothetical protein